MVSSSEASKTVATHGVDVAHTGGEVPGSRVKVKNPLTEETVEGAVPVYVYGARAHAIVNTPVYNHDSDGACEHPIESYNTKLDRFDVSTTVDLVAPTTVKEARLETERYASI